MEGLCPTKEVSFVAKYILKRVLRSAITMLIITVIVFSLLRLMPIEGYFENYDKLSQTQIDVKLRDLGLKDPLPVQLWNYIKQVFHGDLGESNVFRKGVAITEIVGEKIPISLQMGLISLAIALALGLPLGIMMARSTRTLSLIHIYRPEKMKRAKVYLRITPLLCTPIIARCAPSVKGDMKHVFVKKPL